MRMQIIVFGKHDMEQLHVLRRLSRNLEWNVIAMFDTELAIEMMQRQNVGMLVFVNTDTMDENKLRKIGTILNEDIVFLNYSGQPSIEKEAVALLNRQRLEKQVVYSIVDDTLKYENRNISLN